MPYLLHYDGTMTDLAGLENREYLVVGSAPSCNIRLSGEGIAKKHLKIINIENQIYVERLTRKKPTYMNNEPMAGDEHLLVDGDSVTVGDRSMVFRALELGAVLPDEEVEATSSAGVDPKLRLKRTIQQTLLDRMDLKSMDFSGRAGLEVKILVQSALKRIIDEMDTDVRKSYDDPATLYKEMLNDVLGYGPLEDLLADPDITEIMVNGHKKIYVEKKGKIHLTDKTFLDEGQLIGVIEKIVGPLGRRIDESSPLVDARLPDGSRVNAVIHPVALDGPALDIRKFSETPLKIKDLIGFGSMNQAMADFLKLAVEYRRSTIISGGTGSGKTTLLNVVSCFIPPDERIITIEDSAELRLEQDHVVRLEARPANVEGKGEISIRDLVRNALRMRPDRIVVGECRGGEALDMLQAMNTGHDGSLTTVHANSPADVMSRLETMVLMSGMELPIRAIQNQIASAVHLICHQSRLTDGARKIVNISEVTGIQDNRVAMRDIFLFKQTGIDKDGHIQGHYMATGQVPDFVDKLRDRGIDVDMSLFSKE